MRHVPRYACLARRDLAPFFLLLILLGAKKMPALHEEAAGSSGIEIAAATASTSPDGSPLFSASHADSIDTRCTSLIDFGSSDEAPPDQPKRQRLPDILDPATSAGANVENLCFIGAGYVGGLALMNLLLGLDRGALRKLARGGGFMEGLRC